MRKPVLLCALFVCLANARPAEAFFEDLCLPRPGSGGTLSLRVYVALNNTVDELIVFGNEVARQNGWLANSELLPPDVTGGKSAQGANADELKRILVGKIVQGKAYSNAEVYQSGVVTQPLQQTNSLDRLHAMNAALAAYSDTVRTRSDHPAQFTRFTHMPGNSANPDDTSVCWKTAP